MDRLTDALHSFRCCLDSDIEDFLQNKAITFLRRRWCSVYLLVDEQEFEQGHIKIDAYFTLSHKTLIPAEDTSKTKIKETSGLNDSASIHFVLIGQLGKHIERLEDGTLSSADIGNKEILDEAFAVIQESSDLIPCRCVLVECSDNPKVHKVYEDYHFKYFQFDGEHHQYYKKL